MTTDEQPGTAAHRCLADMLAPSGWRRRTAAIRAILRGDLRHYRTAKRGLAAWLRGPK